MSVLAWQAPTGRETIQLGKNSKIYRKIYIWNIQRSKIFASNIVFFLFFLVTSPFQVALCGGYVAVQTELEVLVLKLEATSEPTTTEEPSDKLKNSKKKKRLLMLFIFVLMQV